MPKYEARIVNHLSYGTSETGYTTAFTEYYIIDAADDAEARRKAEQLRQELEVNYAMSYLDYVIRKPGQ